MSVEITPIPVTDPVVVPAVAEIVYDTVFLKQVVIVANQDRTFDCEVIWQLGRYVDGVADLGGKIVFDRFVDILGDEFVTENPEVLTALTPFLAGLTACSKRKGSI